MEQKGRRFRSSASPLHELSFQVPYSRLQCIRKLRPRINYEHDLGGMILANLTLAEAEIILAGSKAKMIELGVKMSISVVDPRGDLITMCKMDGAPWRTPVVSRGKAVASASFEVASGALTDNSQAPIFRAFMALEGGHFIPGQGALPVFRDGEIIGAVGGSGGTAQEDEDCARAGIEGAGFSATR